MLRGRKKTAEAVHRSSRIDPTLLNHQPEFRRTSLPYSPKFNPSIPPQARSK